MEKVDIVIIKNEECNVNSLKIYNPNGVSVSYTGDIVKYLMEILADSLTEPIQ